MSATWSPASIWLMLAPGLVLLGVFVVAPIVFGLWVSLNEFDGVNDMTFVGLQNYVHIFQDPGIMKSWGTTFIFVVGVMIGKNVLGLFLAILVNQKIAGLGFFRTALFIPVLLNVIVAGAFWTNFLDGRNGLLNVMLRGVGMDGLALNWLSDERTALFWVIFVEVWRWTGLHMLIYLAGLQDVDEALYEAAQLDGAGTWRQFTTVTLPSIQPIVFISVLLAGMGAFVRSFDLVWVLTRGGAGTEVVLTRIYNEAFQFGRMGAASALGYLLFGVVAILSIIYVKATREGGAND